MKKTDVLDYYKGHAPARASEEIQDKVLNLKPKSKLLSYTWNEMSSVYTFTDGINFYSSDMQNQVLVDNTTYTVTAPDSLGRVGLMDANGQLVTDPVEVQVFKVLDRLFAGTDNRDGTWTFFDGLKKYRSFKETAHVDIDDVVWGVEVDNVTGKASLKERLNFSASDLQKLGGLIDAYVTKSDAVTDFDKEIVTRAVNRVLDNNENGLADAADIQVLRSMVDKFGVKPVRPDQGDTGEDLSDARKLSDKFSFVQFDLDGDGAISEFELGLAKASIEKLMKFSMLKQDEMDRADVNQDGVLTGFDLTFLKQARSRMFDVNGDTAVTEADYQWYLKIQEYLSFGITDRELQVSNVDGQAGIDDLDWKALEWAIQNSGKIDFDDNGAIQKADVDNITDTIMLIKAGNLEKEAKTIAQKDIDHSGFVSDDDVALLDRTLKQHVDVNGDGFVTPLDVGRISDVIRSKSIVKPTDEEKSLGDIDRDGDVDYFDRSTLSSSLKRAVDVNGDGKINKKDIDTVDEVIHLIKLYTLILTKMPIESRLLYDFVIDIEGRTFYLLHNADGTWKVNDGKKDYGTDAEGVVTVSGVTYRVLEDTIKHSATLKKLYASSVRVADGILEIEGVRYEVINNGNGTYTFKFGEKEYTSQKGLNVVLIEGNPYDLTVDDITERVSLRRRDLDAYESVSDSRFVIQLNDKYYKVERRFLGLPYQWGGAQSLSRPTGWDISSTANVAQSAYNPYGDEMMGYGGGEPGVGDIPFDTENYNAEGMDESPYGYYGGKYIEYFVFKI